VKRKNIDELLTELTDAKASANKLISVIVPVYNVAPYLEQCLNSVVNQTYPNLEIIVVNDGSNDSSGEICQNFALKYDNIKYFGLETNMGLSYARNYGIDKSSGSLIGFVDSDDWIEEAMYSTLYKTMV